MAATREEDKLQDGHQFLWQRAFSGFKKASQLLLTHWQLLTFVYTLDKLMTGTRVKQGEPLQGLLELALEHLRALSLPL